MPLFCKERRDCVVLCSSDLCSRVDREGQDGHEWPVRHRPGGQGEEANQDRAPGPQPRVAREILLVSTVSTNIIWKTDVSMNNAFH